MNKVNFLRSPDRLHPLPDNDDRITLTKAYEIIEKLETEIRTMKGDPLNSRIRMESANIVDKVCEVLERHNDGTKDNVNWFNICSCNKSEYVEARRISMVMIRHINETTLTESGGYFGLGHDSVIYHTKKFKDKVEMYRSFSVIVEEILTNLGATWRERIALIDDLWGNKWPKNASVWIS